MAVQTVNQLDPELVAKAFVEQYYKVILSDPEQAYKFYGESSFLGRPGSDGIITDVTTMKAINENIMAFDYKDCEVDIKSLHAQVSSLGGVIIGVAGSLTGNDKVSRSFSQTFFLAQQDTGFYVLNDFLQFVDVPQPSTPFPVNDDVAEDAPTTESTEVSGAIHLSDHPVKPHTSTPSKKVRDNGVTVSDESEIKHAVVQEVAISTPLDNQSSVEEVTISEPQANQSQNDVVEVIKPVSSAQEVQKPSYALMVAKESTQVQKPATVVVRVSARHGQQPSASEKSKQPPEPTSNAAAPNVLDPPGADIHIKGLPYDITHEELVDALKQFGPVKRARRGGYIIKIKTYEDGFSFAFVEFESLRSAREAVEAGKVTIGDRDCLIDYKKSPPQDRSNRGRPSSGRGGFQRENSRDRANYGGSNRTDNGYPRSGNGSGQTRGSGRNIASQSVYQNESGRK